MSFSLFIKIVLAVLTAVLVVFTGWFFNSTVKEFQSTALELPPAFVNYEGTDTQSLRAENAFNRGQAFLKEGRWIEATREFNYIISFFPESDFLTESRRVLGELNMDELLSLENQGNKRHYTVKRGDSYLRIAKNNETTLDAIMYANEFGELPNLYPGDKLVLMPLDFRLVVDLELNLIQLWDEDRWVKDYVIQKVDLEGVKFKSNYQISNKVGFIEGRAYSPRTPQYRTSRKSLALQGSVLEIGALPTEAEQEVGYGAFLLPEDMEELCLLLRLGNEVEMRF